MHGTYTESGSRSPAARLIAALGIARRMTAEVQDLYSRPIGPRPAVVPLPSVRWRPARRIERAA